MIHQTRGEYDKALKMYEQSLEIERRLGNQSGIATSLHQIGNVYYLQGEYDKALKMYEQSLEIKRRLGNRHGTAMTLGQVSRIRIAQKRFKEAIELCLSVIQILSELRSPEVDIAKRDLEHIQSLLGEEEFRRLLDETITENNT